MELPELSLAPCVGKSSNYESEINLPMKRKQEMIQASVDLQLKDPLPLDWEQCLDLESGRMYYLNRKTLRKTWDWPKDQKLDLELNISSFNQKKEMMDDHQYCHSKKQSSSSTKSSMIALPCSNCHLLVIVSESSPCCPNCKYVHSLALSKSSPSLLSLLN